MDEKEFFSELEALREGRMRLSSSTLKERNDALGLVSDALEKNKDWIFSENRKDIEKWKDKLSESVLKRLLFDEKKLAGVRLGISDVVKLPDPVGKVTEKRELDEGLVLQRVTVPIGTIGMIFESRPDALVQIVALAIKSGNALILKGGKEAERTNRALFESIREGLASSPLGSSFLIQIESHEDVDRILKLDGDIDLLIPRGSNEFVRKVMANTNIPVLGHADGVCSVYVDEFANLEMALGIVIDSKCDYPAACNAAECVIVNGKVKDAFLPMLGEKAKEMGIVLHLDESARDVIDGAVLKDSDVGREYLSLEMNVVVAKSVEDAVLYIQKHGSKHTDAIVTDSIERWRYFSSHVDSADVFWNASTRFADGFRYGFGAEVGISTNKTHARGPVGLEGLTIYKYRLFGSGQIVADYVSGEKQFHHKDLK